MTEPDNPLGDVAGSGDSQNCVDPAPKNSTRNLTPMPPEKPTSAANHEGLVAELSRFSLSNLKSARTFYLLWPISQTPSGQLATTGRPQFRLPWSRYVRLMTVK
jgi:hypothetical protein